MFGLTACIISVLKRTLLRVGGAHKSLQLCPSVSLEEMETDQNDSSSAAAASRHVSSNELSRGKWIALHEMTYTDPTGKERKWEAVTRTTKTGDGTDAVVIIPIVKQRQKADSVVLVKQYRPPLKCYSLEFPAGLVDSGEDPLLCAARELKEETGYVGAPKFTSPGVSLDPGVSNMTVNMVTIEIDGDKEENRNPEPEQEETEFIEVILVQLNDLLDVLNRYDKDGVNVHSILYTYAMVCAQMASPKDGKS